MALHNGLSPVGGESPTGSEGRHGQRFRVLLNAELVSTTEEQPVKVRDISGTGAMIEGQRPIAKASDIILRRGTIEIFAQIAWTDGNQGGVEFDDSLSEAEMMAFVQEPARRASFVPAPFRQDGASDSDMATALTGAAKDSIRHPIGRGVFGR
jgi:hypothetical protein